MLDLTLAEDFTTWKWDTVEQRGFLTFMYRDERSGEIRFRYVAPGILPSVVAFRATDAWISVASFDAPMRKQERARWVPALWADIDPPSDVSDWQDWHEATRQRLYSYVLQPTIMVDSGRGWQAYWLFVQPVTLSDDAALRTKQRAELVALNKCLQRDLDGDHVSDLSRVLRLPGSVNTKTGRMVDVTFVDGPEYELAALQAHFAASPLLTAAMSPPVVATCQRKRGRPPKGVRPDHLRALPEWARRLVLGGAWAGGARYVHGGRVDRSRADMAAVGAMVQAKWSDCRIFAAFERPDWLIGIRYRELRDDEGLTRANGYLQRTIAKARCQP